MGWPTLSPVNASLRPSRVAAHDLGSVWFATPSPQRTFTSYLLPVSRRTRPPSFPDRVVKGSNRPGDFSHRHDGHAGKLRGLGPPVAQSSNSAVWTTGSVVPAAIWVMQPILPAAIRSGAVLSIAAALRSRRRVAISGCNKLYVPAEPQQRCPSGGSSTVNPASLSRCFGSFRTFCPCCNEHAL